MQPPISNMPTSFSVTGVDRPTADRRPSFPEDGCESFPHFLPVPTDRPRSSDVGRAAWKALAFPMDLALVVKKSSGPENDIVPTLLAAFVALLHRYTNDPQLIVGILPRLAECVSAESVAGLAPVLRPLAIDLWADPVFRDLEAHVRQCWGNVARYRNPVVGAPLPMALPRDHDSGLGRFQVVVSHSSAGSASKQTSPGQESAPRPIDKPPGTELHLRFIERHGTLGCWLDYDAALYDEESIRRLLGHYQTLLRGAMANCQERISALPLLTEAEWRQLIDEWGQPVPGPPATEEKLVHVAFAEQAARTPDAVAVEFESYQLTYRELDTQANQLAHYLRRRGVGPDVRAGICLERSPDLVVGVLGILKAGGAFVPLEPSYPPAQLKVLVSETRPAVLITHSGLSARLPGDAAAVICLDTDSAAIAAESTAAPVVHVTRENLATVLFSSGSTGKPKAIRRPHDAVRRAALARALFQLSAADRHVLKTSLDSSLFGREILWPLLSGGRMIIAGPRAGNDAAALLKLVIRHEITIITLVPSLLRPLVAAEGLEQWTSLRHLTCFGEPLSADVEERFCRRLAAKLSSFYGTTEAPSIALREVRGTGPRPLGNLGYRLGDYQIYIVDERLRPVPIGVPGELVAGGSRLSAGYLNLPEATKQRFIPNPFHPESAARLYRTGDRVRWRPDGSLEFLGRLDDQCKVRGHRIEPSQIETALADIPDVAEAAVVARPNQLGENQLVAYLVTPSRTLTVIELRARLAQRLPAHMMPSIFVRQDQLPRKPNGKLDRAALPGPVVNLLELGSVYVAAQTPLEDRLTEIWRQILGVERVGIHDDFFALGGHSLLAAELLTRLGTVLSSHVTFRDLLANPTIAGLASLPNRTAPSVSDRPPAGLLSPHPTWSSRQSAGDVNLFLEMIRPGSAERAVVCVGDFRPISVIVDRFSDTIPIWRLKLDGLHVWPPRYLTIDEQIEQFVEGLVSHCHHRALAIVGFSYGGLLAYRLASALVARNWTDVKVLLIEPTVPRRYQPAWLRAKRLLRLVFPARRILQWLIRVARRTVNRTTRDSSRIGAEKPAALDRWTVMGRHLSKSLSAVKLLRSRCPMALAGSTPYHARFGKTWRNIHSEGIDACVLQAADGHFGWLQQPSAGQLAAFMERWYHGNLR